MGQKTIFYHAGCPVCVSAEEQIVKAIDKTRYDVEIVDLGAQKSRVAEAKNMGVESVPALVIESRVYHINFGAAITDLGE